MVNFRRNLTAEPAKKVHRDLHDFDLPRLNDVHAEFETLAEELGAG